VPNELKCFRGKVLSKLHLMERLYFWFLRVLLDSNLSLAPKHLLAVDFSVSRKYTKSNSINDDSET